MTAVTFKQLAASAMTLLLMAAETMTIAIRPDPNREADTLAQVEAFASSLEAGGKARYAVSLEKGREYHVVGSCVAGCDIDLRLFSPSGHEIDRHVGAGTPEVAVIPSASARYHTEVTMAACPIHPCAYTVNVLAR